MRTRWWQSLLLALPPLVAALWIGSTTIAGGSFWPWNPAGMIDLEVYRRTGSLVLAGGDIFNADGLPWIYPPFAALLAVAFAVVPLGVAGFAWLAMCAAALAAILHRFGITGWRLSLATTAAVVLANPVRETLGFGQLGIFLVAAVVLDSVPGPRLLPRRVLPEGWLTGVATAVKLTPAVVAVYTFFAGRRKVGVTSFLAFLVATALGFALLWSESVYYWTKLVGGDSGMNSGIVYATNQSVMGVWTRVTGTSSLAGLAFSAAVVALGVVAAVSMHHRGQVALSVCLAGLTSLLASPISWSHHYVWLIPLSLALWQARGLPAWFRRLGLGYAAWGLIAPFMWLPRGDNIELSYNPWQQLVVNVGVIVGVALLATSLAVARRNTGRDTIVESGELNFNPQGDGTTDGHRQADRKIP